MADHFQKIVRTWRHKTSNTSYHQIVSEPVSSFFGAGSKVLTSEKWVAWGRMRAVAAIGSTGGVGNRITYLYYKSPGSTSASFYTGDVDIVGGSQFAFMGISGSNLEIQARALGDSGSSIISVTLEMYFIGGSGPTA